MTEEVRQQFTAFISNYLTKVLNEEKTIEEVPAYIRKAVQEDFDNREQFVPQWASKLMNGYITEKQVPKMLKELVFEEVKNTQEKTNEIYIADVIEGVIELEDIPLDAQEYIKSEVERHIGKKLV